jgi:uncharacterized membrane protein YhaH (DUF805 family)
MSWGQYLFSFKGRINRALLWQFVFISFLINLVMRIFMIVTLGVESVRSDDYELAASTTAGLVVALLDLAVSLILFLANTSLQVRRLHDRGRSGWWIAGYYAVVFSLVLLIVASGREDDPAGPLAIVALLVVVAMSLWLFVEAYCLRGTIGENRYGPDPLDPIHQAHAFD